MRPWPPGEPISSEANPFQRTRPSHPRERAGVDVLIGDIACPQDWPRPLAVPMASPRHCEGAGSPLRSDHVLQLPQIRQQRGPFFGRDESAIDN